MIPLSQPFVNFKKAYPFSNAIIANHPPISDPAIKTWLSDLPTSSQSEVLDKSKERL